MTDLGRLGEIVQAKRREVAERFAGVSIDAIRADAKATDRSLAAAMARPGGRFIFEFKRASPSAGLIRDAADPAAIARAYSGVADAMSVLTDARFFGGSLDDLRAARTMFDGPILAKDFVVDRRQLVEARIAGADAGLAILSVLDDDAYRTIADEAARLAMDLLVEVHDEAEMRRARALGARLIGINNRDLKNFTTDLAVTERLAPLAGDALVISESGIAGRADIERLGGIVDGFLVGSSVMRAADPRDAARALAFGRVKLCGLRTAEDLAAAAPACFAGLVFVPRTPRAVSVEQAGRLLDDAPGHPPLVGVFRDAPLADAVAASERLPLHAIQLHGNEDVHYVRSLRRSFTGQIWTAESDGRVRSGGDRILFDTGAGGTGRAFDWGSVKTRPELSEALLAGGIGPGNARAAQALGPYAIDVGSSVDARPGVKSHAAIARLFDALRPAPRAARVARCA